MTDWTLRAGEPEDAEAIAALFNQPLVRASTLRLPYTAVSGVAKWLTGFDNEKRLIVAPAAGVAVGFVVVTRFTGRLAHSGDVFIAVHDAHRRKGLGRALMAAAIDLADNWMGLVRLQLEVSCDNTDAIALCRPHGIAGESGPGKSTLISCVAGHLALRGGRCALTPAPRRSTTWAESR